MTRVPDTDIYTFAINLRVSWGVKWRMMERTFTKLGWYVTVVRGITMSATHAHLLSFPCAPKIEG